METDGPASPTDAGELAARVGLALNLPPPAARTHWREFDRWLSAAVETGIACSPTQRQDDVWHAVKDDEAFERHCLSRFGQRIEHHEQDEPVADGFDVLRAHAAARYGPLDAVLWDTSAGLGTCIPKLTAQRPSAVLPTG